MFFSINNASSIIYDFHHQIAFREFQLTNDKFILSSKQKRVYRMRIKLKWISFLSSWQIIWICFRKRIPNKWYIKKNADFDDNSFYCTLFHFFFQIYLYRSEHKLYKSVFFPFVFLCHFNSIYESISDGSSLWKEITNSCVWIQNILFLHYIQFFTVLGSVGDFITFIIHSCNMFESFC